MTVKLYTRNIRMKTKSGAAGRQTLQAAPNNPAQERRVFPFVGIRRFVSWMD